MTTYTYSVSVWNIENNTVTDASIGTLSFVMPEGVDTLSYGASGYSGLLSVIQFRGYDILSVFADGQFVDETWMSVTRELGTMVWDGSRETIIYAMSIVENNGATTYFLELGGDPLPSLDSAGNVTNFLSRLNDAGGAPAGSGFGPGEDIDLASIPSVTVTEDDRFYLNFYTGPGQVNAGIGDDFIIASEMTGQQVDGGEGTDTFRSEGYGLGAYVVEYNEGTFNFFMNHGFGDLEPAFDMTNVEWFEFSRVGGGYDRYSSAELRLALLDTTPVELLGTAEDDLLEAGAGADRLSGEGGHDTLIGGEGNDTLIGGEGNDVLQGGGSDIDVRDVIYGGNGNDSIDGGYGNDELRGDAGNDTILGGYGADTVIGGTGDDNLTAQAFGDEIFGGDGADFINGGFGHDRLNGGEGADRFFHLGVADHGSDWVQDYSAAEGDVLVFGQAATRDQFQVNLTETANAGAEGTQEAFVIYRPTGQILWALVDGAAQSQINLVISGTQYDLLA